MSYVNPCPKVRKHKIRGSNGPLESLGQGTRERIGKASVSEAKLDMGE